jgi:uncharacterized protein with von Willebrand factor type A (vWA) domain
MKSELGANIITEAADGGRLAANILIFARVLRAAGLPIGTGQIALATEAVMAAGVYDPRILYWTLHAVFVTRAPDHDIFHQAFFLIWRDPGYIQQLLSIMAPKVRAPQEKRTDAVARRLADSLFLNRPGQEARERDMLELDARGTASELDSLAQRDFEQMSADELRLAREAIRHMAAKLRKLRMRRYQTRHSGPGSLDLRKMLRRAGPRGTDGLELIYRERIRRAPPLIVICDISGSMESYARLFLHFLYMLMNEGERVHAFLFGTRLTNVTRALRGRDPDAAINKAAGQVQDWSGGTRIGESLRLFNKLWARRVLGQNATVLLLTDGLDRSGGEGIANEARRLRASCRRLLWLNPLLRFDAYAPIAAGAAELSRNVTEMRACHNLRHLADLTRALGNG